MSSVMQVDANRQTVAIQAEHPRILQEIRCIISCRHLSSEHYGHVAVLGYVAGEGDLKVFAGGLDKGSLIWMNDGKGRFRKR